MTHLRDVSRKPDPRRIMGGRTEDLPLREAAALMRWSIARAERDIALSRLLADACDAAADRAGDDTITFGQAVASGLIPEQLERTTPAEPA